MSASDAVCYNFLPLQRCAIMNDFTPVSALAGGVLIGLAATLLLLFDGRIAGVSGIVAGLSRPDGEPKAWRAMFVVGLLCGGVVLRIARPSAFEGLPHTALPVMAVAGLLVGLGARAAGGCTSGHGVCGTARLSLRSILVTVTFIVAGAFVVFLTHRGGAS